LKDKGMNVQLIIFNIIIILCFFTILLPTRIKKPSKFWITQPIQKKNGELFKQIIDTPPKLSHKPGFILQKVEYWSIKKRNTIPDFPENLYPIIVDDPDSKVYTLIDIAKKRNAGYIFGQLQLCPEKNKNIVYVSGLYIHPIYRGKGLAEMLITGIINAWWKKCKQFYFIHDKETIPSNIATPIEKKNIDIISPWLSFWNPKSIRNITPKNKLIHFNIQNKNTKHNLIQKDFGVEFHIHNYSLIIHSVENSAFTNELMYKLSTKYPYIIFIYVPQDINIVPPLKSYSQYIYGWNIRGGKNRENICCYNF
jgi:GNAT superfamily N-acetyltransferase